jgi:4-hydroxybutyrate CoA-transferase
MHSSAFPAGYGNERSWTSRLESGDTVFVGSSAGEPATLIDDLLALPHSAPPITIVQFPHGGAEQLVKAARPGMRFIGLAANPDIVALHDRGTGSYRLSTFFQSAEAVRHGLLPIDVALIQVAPPDSQGRFSLGIAVDVALDAARRARLVVAQVNRWMPRTQGDCFLTYDEIDVLIEADRELPGRSAPILDEQAVRVAARVAALVPNAATIEVGVGETMAAVLEGLGEHRDLTIHTGLFVEQMIPLIKAGVVTGRFSRLPGRLAVANQATGSLTVADFVHDNSAVAFMPASYTHSPAVLREQHQLRAINGALEVDLFGRVNSEYIGGKRVGSAGGLLDFVRAAREAEGGRSIIALRSTSANRERTKIVARLDSPGSCTIDADLADIVVTENGVAELAGASAEERVQRMIAIADPAYREQLSHQSATLT